MFCGSQLVWLGATNTCTDILTVIVSRVVSWTTCPGGCQWCRASQCEKIGLCQILPLLSPTVGATTGVVPVVMVARPIGVVHLLVVRRAVREDVAVHMTIVVTPRLAPAVVLVDVVTEASTTTVGARVARVVMTDAMASIVSPTHNVTRVWTTRLRKNRCTQACNRVTTSPWLPSTLMRRPCPPR